MELRERGPAATLRATARRRPCPALADALPGRRAARAGAGDHGHPALAGDCPLDRAAHHARRAQRATARRSPGCLVDEPRRPHIVTRDPVRGYERQAERVAGQVATMDGLVAVAPARARPAAARRRRSRRTCRRPTAWPRCSAASSATVEANLPGVLADIDTEYLHDLRVAVRKARSLVKLAGDVLAGDVARLGHRAALARRRHDARPRPRRLRARRAGPGRPPTRRRHAADLEPFAAHLAAKRAAAFAQLQADLRSPRLRRVRAMWRAVVDAARRRRARRLTVAELAAERLARAHRSPGDAGSRITDASPAEQLHELRKRGKEYRYLFDVFQAVEAPGAAQARRTGAEGAAGVPRRVPGQRGAGRRDPHVRHRDGRRRQRAAGHAAGDGRDGRPARRRPAAARSPARAFVRPLRPPFVTAAPATCAGRRTARPGAVKVVATYNIKGGVGKTSTAVNVAHLAARDGRRTLLWDLDPQGAATYVFRVKPKVKGGGRRLVDRRTSARRRGQGHRLRRPRPRAGRLLVPPHGPPPRRAQEADAPARRLLRPLADEYDLVVLDCPPSISLVSESVMDAADVLLVPLIPTTLSLNTFDQLRDVRPPVRRRAARRARVLLDGRPAQAAAPRRRGGTSTSKRAQIAHTAIPALSAIEQMAGRRAPVTASPPRQPGGGRCYEALWTEIRGHDGTT